MSEKYQDYLISIFYVWQKNPKVHLDLSLKLKEISLKVRTCFDPNLILTPLLVELGPREGTNSF